MWSKTCISLAAATAIALGAGAASAVPFGSTGSLSGFDNANTLVTPAATMTTVKKKTVTKKGDSRVVKKTTRTKTVRRGTSTGLTIRATGTVEGLPNSRHRSPACRRGITIWLRKTGCVRAEWASPSSNSRLPRRDCR